MVRRLIVDNGPLKKAEKNKLAAESMYIMTSIIRYGLSGLPAKPITSDDIDRILVCLRVLAEDNGKVSNIFTNDCRQVLGLMLQEQAEFEALHTKVQKKKNISAQADDSIMFNQLVSRMDMVNGEDVFEVSLSQAVGFNAKKNDTDVSLEPPNYKAKPRSC